MNEIEKQGHLLASDVDALKYFARVAASRMVKQNHALEEVAVRLEAEFRRLNALECVKD